MDAFCTFTLFFNITNIFDDKNSAVFFGSKNFNQIMKKISKNKSKNDKVHF